MTKPTVASDVLVDGIVVLVADRVYTKTGRFIDKLRTLLAPQVELLVALVSGFGEGPALASVCLAPPDVIVGDIENLAGLLVKRLRVDQPMPHIVALNESALLPGLALRRALGLPGRRGLLEACDKTVTRKLLLEHGLGVPFVAAPAGAVLDPSPAFPAQRYVVKPAFGASSKDVRFFGSWEEVVAYIAGSARTLDWVPAHVLHGLGAADARSDGWIVEPYLQGTEFSIDGWVRGDDFSAVVQHKLRMIESGSFVGDGPTISPPAMPGKIAPGYNPLVTPEASISAFGRKALEAIGFDEGVFHIEAREMPDGSLNLIEINPRAPGGSLWRSAMVRTGEDLELFDAAIQLGLTLPTPADPVAPFVLHYPFYAPGPGVLKDWGDLVGPSMEAADTLSVDFAVPLESEFRPADLQEEPYLAFAVAHAPDLPGLFEKCREVLQLKPPLVGNLRRADDGNSRPVPAA